MIRTLEERMILFYVLLYCNAVYLAESTCSTEDVKSNIGNHVCNNYYGYKHGVGCHMEYPIVKRIISCSKMSLSNIILNVNVGRDANFSVILKVTDSDADVLPTSSFKNTHKLSILYLENSNIRKILPGAFNYLDDLKELYLEGNQLTTISDGLFNSLTLLEKLDLSRNQIQDISDHAFEGGNLKELRISHNNISQIAEVLLSSLTSLTTLDISWNGLNNITNFKNVPLTRLDLSHNSIDVVDFELFSKNLHKIDLSFNSISEVINSNAIQASEITLSHNSIRDLGKMTKVTDLDVSHNELNTIGSDLSGHNLKRLNAGFNCISSINKDAFFGLFNLDQLLLNNNNLSSIPNSCFKDLKSLTYLDLSKNKLTRFAFGTFDNLLNLKVLNISHNNLKDLQQYTFYSLHSLTDLFFQNNEISEVNVDDLKLHVPQLKTVNLDGNIWSCKKLLDIVHSFKKIEVSFRNGNCQEESNIYGIKCYETVTEKGSTSEIIDIGNSSLHGFFNEDFRKTVMYNYFNKEFKESNFFKYLEGLINNANSGNVDKLINEMKLNYSDVYNKEFTQSAMYNYFNEDFRKSNFFKYLESFRNQAANEENSGKLSDANLELFKKIVEKNSDNSNNSSGQGFNQSDMHKYFNEDFKNSNFFKYLESLNVHKYPENITDSEQDKIISSFQVGKTNNYIPNYTGFLLFISIMLIVIICVIIVVITLFAYLFRFHIKTCNAQKKEEVQLI